MKECCQSETRLGSNPQPDHQSDTHPTKPPRLAKHAWCAVLHQEKTRIDLSIYSLINLLLSTRSYRSLAIHSAYSKEFYQTAWMQRLIEPPLGAHYMEDTMQKSVFGPKWSVKAQISLRRCTGWSEPSLSANRIIGYYGMHIWMESKGPDDTLPVHRIIWISTFCACSKALFAWCSLYGIFSHVKTHTKIFLRCSRII